MILALDAMGGDLAPKAIVKGALLAREQLGGDVEILLVGDQGQIADLLRKEGAPGDTFPIAHAPSVIEMGEHPAKAFQSKPDSSIAVGFSLLKSGEADCFCSAGNTGAMLVGCMMVIKAVRGVIRPGIAGFFPKLDGRYGIVMDVGLNADVKPDVLAQFAQMGALYYGHMHNIPRPKVGLLSLGREESKGTMLTQAAYPLINMIEGIDFVGNVEGSDIFSGDTDVIVCDGYVGNVVLKMGEMFYEVLKTRGVVDDFVSMFNYESVGGSPVMGVNGNVIIAHGRSTPPAIAQMLTLARDTVASGVVEKLQSAFN